MGKKKKKEKIVYVDDGSTIADMSGVSGGFGRRAPYKPRVSLKTQWETYLGAVKMMITPMLAVIVGLCIIYMVLSFVFWFL